MIDVATNVLAFILVLFIPGFIMSYAFYLPGETIADNILDDRLARFLLSIGLSLLIIPVSTYALNYITTIGPDLDSLVSVLTISVLISIISVSIRVLINRIRG